MRAFSAGELDRMQDVQETSMQDICQILVRTETTDDYGNPDVTYAVPTEQEDREQACGLEMVNPDEVQQSGDVPEIDAHIRLPLDATLTSEDRIKVTHRYGELLDEAIVFEVEGPIKRGPSGLVVEARLVDDAS